MKITIQEKEIIAKRYLDGENVKCLIAEFRISRSSLYSWGRKYKKVKIEKANIVGIKEFRDLQRKVKRLEEQIEIFRKINCKYNDLLRTKLYALEELYGKHNIHILCNTLGVSRGTFYNHILRNKKYNTTYAKHKEELREEIQKIYDESNQIFGATKIWAILKSKGIKASEETIRKLMRDMGLISIRTDSKKIYDKEQRQCRNKLQQQFLTEAPNQVWVSDITYFRYKEKNYYVCAVMDLFARKIIGCKIGIKNSTQLAKTTFRNAYLSRKPVGELLFHTDNGNNYRSYSFRNYLKSLSVTQSFSRPYVPYDNSVMESFFSSMKREELYRRKYKSEKELYKSVYDYIEFYNDKRPHYKNSYKSPNKKEEDFFIEKIAQQGS